MDYMTSNTVKSFYVWINETRVMLIITMLGMIGRMMLSRFQRKKQKAMAISEIDILIRIIRRLEESKEYARSYIIHWDGKDGFEMEGTTGRYVICLQQRTCSCQPWDLSSIPCHHACAAIYHMRVELENLDAYYNKEMYLRAYDGLIGCVPSIFHYPYYLNCSLLGGYYNYHLSMILCTVDPLDWPEAGGAPMLLMVQSLSSAENVEEQAITSSLAIVTLSTMQRLSIHLEMQRDQLGTEKEGSIKAIK